MANWPKISGRRECRRNVKGNKVTTLGNHFVKTKHASLH